MLILNRRKGEAIDLEGCVVTVLAINGSVVKLGIEAPDGVRVMRTELLKQEKLNGIDDETETHVEQPDARQCD